MWNYSRFGQMNWQQVALTLGSLCLCTGLCLAPSQVAWASETPSSVVSQATANASADYCTDIKAFRYSFGKKIRLVVECSQVPLSQVAIQSSPPALVVDFYDADTQKSLPGRLPDNNLISGWSLQQTALNKLRWTINTNFALRSEDVVVSYLDNPGRLVIDLPNSVISSETYALTPGVSWTKREYRGGQFPYLLWNQLNVNLDDPEVHLDVGLGHDGLRENERLSDMVKRTGALAGINGSYFNTAGGPLALVVQRGKMLSPHVGRRPARSVFAITADGLPLVERLKSTPAGISNLDGDIYPSIDLALGGGPTLVKNGQIALTTEAEQLGPNGNDITRSCGRTAVAVKDRQIIMATASGYKSSHSQGVKLEQMAQLLINVGAQQAVNLDGGGSVDMAIAGKIVANGPGAGSYERPIANALLIFDERPSQVPYKVKLAIDKEELEANGSSKATATAVVTCLDSKPVPDGTPVFFSGRGLSCPSQALTKDGRAQVPLTALRGDGFASLTARSGSISDVENILTKAGALQALKAQVESLQTVKPAENGSTEAEETPSMGESNGGSSALVRRFTVTILAEDKWYNGLSEVPLKLRVDGEEVFADVTDRQGQLTVSLDAPLSSRSLQISAPQGEELIIDLQQAASGQRFRSSGAQQQQ